MSDDADSKKKISDLTDKAGDSDKKISQAITDEERKQLIEKIKANLFLEDQESIQLYASLIKVSIP